MIRFRHGIWSFSDISEERPLVELTVREREVAILSCRGLSAKEIGVELGLSYRTIEAYRARLLEKFGARKAAGTGREIVRDASVALLSPENPGKTPCLT